MRTFIMICIAVIGFIAISIVYVLENAIEIFS
jgi:hypothetical protein